MRVFCQYSGVEFDLTGFASTKLTYIHPIFAAEPRWLLSRMGSWAAQKYNEEESKLLFLAILHNTDLVEFRATAYPEASLVAQQMEPLARIYSWMLGLSRPQLVLPKFVIQHDNRHLKNVKHWIDTWFKARKDYEDGYVKQLRDQKLSNKEEALERLIKNAQKSTEDYAGLLCTWALQATDAPKALHDYWRELFTLRGLKVYAARRVDLQELLDHMEEHLEHGSIYAAATLKHLRTLVRKNQAGLNYGLGINDEDLAEIDSTPFTFVEDSIEEHNKQVIAATAPEEEPLRKDFPSLVGYLRAKAAWELAQKAREYAEEFTTQVEDDLSQDEELNELLEGDGRDERRIEVEISRTDEGTQDE